MTSSFSASVLLVLVTALVASGRESSTFISFPSSNSMAEVKDEDIGIRIYTKEFRKGQEAVQSIANSVLKVLEYEEVRTSPRNWVVSPLSLTVLIAQLLIGSRGRLQSVLADSLSLKGSTKSSSRLEIQRQLGNLMRYIEKSSNTSCIMELRGALFHQSGVSLKPTYKHALLDFYDVQIFPVDFVGRPEESLRQMNDWVKSSTHGKIPILASFPPPPSTVCLLMNAIYFSGTWKLPFDPDFTAPGSFYIDDTHEVKTQFMMGEKELLYKNSSEMQLVGIPYKDWKIVLYVLLPHKELTKSLTVNRLDELISSARRENITLVMPKVKMLSAISLRKSVLKYLFKIPRTSVKSVILPNYNGGRTNVLPRSPVLTNEVISTTPKFRNGTRAGCVSNAKGCKAGAAFASQSNVTAAMRNITEPYFQEDPAFDDADKFDVTGASNDRRFKINDVIHQVSISIDETGTDIAAVTSTLVDYAGDVFLLRIDRPFWFFVRHEETSTHLFWGRIVNPTIDTN